MISEILARLVVAVQAQPANFAVRLTVLLLICLAVLVVTRRQAARQRHALVLSGLLAALLLPVFCWLLPAWPMLPAIDRELVSSSPAVDPSAEPDVAASWPAQYEFPSVETMPRPGPAPAPLDQTATQRSDEADDKVARIDSTSLLPASATSDSHINATSPAVTEPALATMRDTIPGWLLAWSVCSLLLLARHFIATLCLQRKLREMCSAAPQYIEETAHRIGRQLQLTAQVAVKLSSGIHMPALIGWRRPVIVLPLDATAWSDEQLRVVLLHEMGHVRRCDALWQMLTNLTKIIYFWHPLVWLATRKLVQLRESACDDLVIAHGIAPTRYAAYLVALVAGPERLSSTRLIGMARRPGLESRIRVLLQQSSLKRSESRRGVLSGTALIVATALLVAAAVPAQPSAAIAETPPAATEPAAPPATNITTESAADDDTAAQGNGSIRVQVQDTDEQPIPKSSVGLWHRLANDAPQTKSTWRDDIDGQLWELVSGRSIGTQTVFDGLLPGTYRVAARSGHHQDAPIGISAPVTIDAANTNAAVVVTMRAGANLRLRLRSAESGEVLDHCFVVLERLDKDLPYDEFRIREIDSSSYHFIHGLPPGRYRITAGRNAYSPDEPQYVMDDPAPEIALNVGEEREMEVDLIPVALTDEYREQRWPWIVEGTVRDRQGRPVADAMVYASTGWGSLRRTGSSRTDEDGFYRFRFGPGMLMGASGERPPLNLQAALIAVRKMGYSEINLSRQGDRLAATRQPEEDERNELYGRDPDDIFLPNKKQEVHFVLTPAARIVVEVVDQNDKPLSNYTLSLKGRELPPGSSVGDWARLDATGRGVLRDVPVGLRWNFEVSAPERRAGTWQTTSFTLSEPQNVSVRLRRVTDELTNLERLEIVEFLDPNGNDLRPTALHNDPLTMPSLDMDGQQQARRVLRQAVEANRLWLVGPVEGVRTVAYRSSSENSIAHDIQVAAGENAWKLRGIVFSSSLPQLASHAEHCVFQLLEQNDDRIRLAFRWLPMSDEELQPPRLILGHSPANNLRYSGPVTSGILDLDPQTFQVRRFEHGDVIESFSDYVRLPTGLQAPRQVQIERGEERQSWEFEIYSPGLWLLKSAEIPGYAKLENRNIRINDAPAEAIH